MVIRMKTLCALILLCGLAASAQDQQPPPKSLGEIARENRANKKPGTPVRVIDNDAFPSADTAAPAVAKDTTSDAKNPDAKTTDAKKDDIKNNGTDQAKVTPSEQQKWDSWKTKLDAQKHEVTLLQREVDVTEREARVRAANYYADAGANLRDPGKYAEETRKQQEELQAKTLLLTAAKQRLADLQEQARKDGVPFSVIDN
jgi:hypothetical protein